jgi:AcrR family transcriptional regulator
VQAVATAVGSSRDLRKAARRHRLLEAALRLFSEQGYHDTTVDDVVAAARTSKSAFYEHFESKEDCFRVLLAAEGGDLMKAVVDAAGRGSGPRDRVRRGIDAFVRTCASRSRVARLFLVESVGVSPAIEEVRHEIQGRFAAMVESEVQHAAASDDFYASVDPIVYGRAVVGAVNEATGYFVTHAEDDPRAVSEGLCRIFAP